MPNRDAPAQLAAFVVETLGAGLAHQTYLALAETDVKERATATAGLYWRTDRVMWSRIDSVLRLNRYEITRRAVVVGLAARFGEEAPRLVETDRESTRRRAREASLRKAPRHFGEPGPGGKPTHRAATAG